MIKCIYVIWCLCRNLVWVSSTRFEGFFNEWCILGWKGRIKGLRRKVLALEFPSQPPFYNSFVLSPTVSINLTFFWCGRHWKVYAGTCKHHWAGFFVFLMCCAIWYDLYKLKNVKITHGGVLLLVKLQVFA